MALNAVNFSSPFPPPLPPLEVPQAGSSIPFPLDTGRGPGYGPDLGPGHEKHRPGGAGKGALIGEMMQDMLSLMELCLNSKGSSTTSRTNTTDPTSLLNTLSGLTNSTGSSNSSSTSSTTSTTTGSTTSTTGTSTTTGTTTASRTPVIAQIDVFGFDSSIGVNHGVEVANRLQKDNGAGQAKLIQYDLSKSGANSSTITNALNDVIAKVKGGQTIDAVEMPLQAYGNSMDATSVKNAVKQLSDLGIPVVIAAGNDGPTNKNILTDPSAFIVENIENGKLDPQSGDGNVSFAETTTSWASASFASVVAAKHAQGQNLAQLKKDFGVVA